LHPRDGQGLHGPLVHPAGFHLMGARDADLDPGGIRQIDDMVDHTMGPPPFRLTASAEMVVAGFRLEDAQVALGQGLHAAVAIALGKAGLGGLAAMDAENAPGEAEADRPAQKGIEGDGAVPDRQGVLDGFARLIQHFPDGTRALFHSWKITIARPTARGWSRSAPGPPFFRAGGRDPGLRAVTRLLFRSIGKRKPYAEVLRLQEMQYLPQRGKGAGRAGQDL